MKILRTLAVKQTFVAITIGLVLSLALSAVEVALGFRNDVGHILQDSMFHLDAAEAAASLAAYKADQELAAGVAAGLGQTGYFERVSIYDDFGTLLSRTVPEGPLAIPHVFMWFDRQLATSVERTLQYGAPPQTVGVLRAKLSIVPFVRQFRSSVYGALLRHAVGSLLLVLALAYFFYVWITRPVLQLARQLGNVDLASPLPDSIQTPRRHANDEIGLVARTLENVVSHAADANRLRTSYERQLRESEGRFRRIYENVQDGYYETDIRGTILEISPSFERMTGYSRNELIGQSVLLLYEDPRDRDRMIDSVLQLGRLTDYEVTLVRKSGEPFRCSLQSIVSRDSSGKPVGTIGSLRDISARKVAEAKVRASLSEKEMLLREIHHRVKNNLQIISSLLHLQEGTMADEESRPFLESQNRIAAMALLHEELYESETLSNVDLRSYVTKLANQLAQLYDPTARIAIELKLDDIHMQMDAAVPCGLIINELVTNSFKHAFTEAEQGTLLVELVRSRDGYLRLSVSDSGEGYPVDLDVASGATLGLSLVESLAEQLLGELTIGNRGGASCAVDFPVPPVRSSS